MAIGEPRLRSDLVTSRQDGFVVVKDPAAGRFFRLREVEHFIASQLDGATSLGELRERIERKFGAAPNPEVVQPWVKFATSPRTGGYEYVWHCHILEHEEHDMMRPLVVSP